MNFINQLLENLKKEFKNLANLKSEVDKLDVDKLKPIPTDLSKLSHV